MLIFSIQHFKAECPLNVTSYFIATSLLPWRTFKAIGEIVEGQLLPNQIIFTFLCMTLIQISSNIVIIALCLGLMTQLFKDSYMLLSLESHFANFLKRDLHQVSLLCYKMFSSIPSPKQFNFCNSSLNFISYEALLHPQNCLLFSSPRHFYANLLIYVLHTFYVHFQASTLSHFKSNPAWFKNLPHNLQSKHQSK